MAGLQEGQMTVAATAQHGRRSGDAATANPCMNERGCVLIKLCVQASHH